MPYLYSPERYARSVATIREEAARLGRDLDGFVWYAYLFVCMDDDGDEARRTAARFLGGTYRSDFAAMIDRVACVGTPDEVTDRLTAFVRAGAQHLIVVPIGDRQASARRLLGEILPAVTERTRPA